MKKVIFVHLLNDFSGSPKVLSQVIKSVQESGNEVALYSGKSSEGFLSNITKDEHFYFYKRFENKLGTLFSFTLSQCHLFFKLLKYRNQDVILYVNTLLPFGAALAGKIMGKPVLYHVHETSVKPLMLKRFLRYVTQKTAVKIIFVSQFLEQKETFKNINQNVIYNAVPKAFLTRASTSNYQCKDANGVFNVLMLCSLKAYKGVNEFVEIANYCKNRTHIHFAIILNASQKDIDAYFQDIIMPANISVFAKQKDLHSFYKASSLVLNLSRVNEVIETFGLTIIEAMSYGIPVIVPPVGGPSEIVTNGVEGFLMSSFNVAQIAEKITELSNSPEKCLELSRHAKKRSTFFNEDNFNKEILKVLHG